MAVYDVAIIGAGIAGMATAARVQSAGLSTVVLEAHGQPGGCAGFYRRRGFSFDVGATTLVDFQAGGLGSELVEQIGMQPIRGEALPGYVAWLPDRRVTLHRDHRRWDSERLRAFGATQEYRRFWRLMDQISDVFWHASRRGIKLPIENVADVVRTIQTLGLRNLSVARFGTWTMGDALRRFHLREDAALVGLLSMLIEDTVHSTVDDAPLINAALGITIRGAGLTRAKGGMRGFWRDFVRCYRRQGGHLLVGRKVRRVSGKFGEFTLATRHERIGARQVVSAVPTPLTARIAPEDVRSALRPYLARDAESHGGAIVVFLGVPEDEVASQSFTHHQLLQNYSERLGNGNNMFISVSTPGDTDSAPVGHRSVMISTHCDLEPWEKLSPERYETQKQQVAERLVGFAREVYPDLGRRAIVYEVGTPRTYERFTHRPRGAVGGLRLTLKNSNQAAVPHQLGCRGFWQVGDTTWPGLGTVACVLGSRIVAERILKQARNTTSASHHGQRFDDTPRSPKRSSTRVAETGGVGA